MADVQFQQAKAYLAQGSKASGVSVYVAVACFAGSGAARMLTEMRRRYDHVAELLGRLLREKPDDAVDILESLSLEVKRGRYRQAASVGVGPKHDVATPNATVDLAKRQRRLFKSEAAVSNDDDDNDEVENEDCELPNLVDLMQQFEAAGAGLGRDEGFRVLLSLRKLINRVCVCGLMTNWC